MLYQLQYFTEEKLDQDLKAGTWRRNLARDNGGALFIVLISMSSSAYFFIGWRSTYRDRTSTIMSALPHEPLIKEKSDMLTGQSNGGDFSIEVPFSKLTLVCVKMSKANQHR